VSRQTTHEEDQCHPSRSLPALLSRKGKAEEYIAAFTPLLEQAEKEPGTVLYALYRSKDDPRMFWTTEVYVDDDAFAAHRASEAHAAASPVFTELIAASDFVIGETLVAKGLAANG